MIFLNLMDGVIWAPFAGWRKALKLNQEYAWFRLQKTYICVKNQTTEVKSEKKNFLSPPFAVATLSALFFSPSPLFFLYSAKWYSWYSISILDMVLLTLQMCPKHCHFKCLTLKSLQLSFEKTPKTTWIILRMRAYSTSTPNTWMIQETT